MANERVTQPRLQIGSRLCRLCDQAFGFDDIKVGQRGRGANRVAGIGIAMAEGAILLATSHQHIPHALRNDAGRKREIGRGQPLGDGHHVGRNAEHGRTEHLAQAAEPADHFIGDEQDVVLAQDRLHGFIIARRRRDHAACAHQRLHDHGGNRVGAFRCDQRLQIGHQLGGEFGIGQAMAFPQPARRHGVADHRQRQIEPGMQAGQAGHARRHDRHAMIAALAGDDLLLLRPAQDVVVIPGQFDLRVVGVGPAVAIEHTRHAGGRHLDQALGQDGRRVAGHARKRMAIAEAG